MINLTKQTQTTSEVLLNTMKSKGYSSSDIERILSLQLEHEVLNFDNNCPNCGKAAQCDVINNELIHFIMMKDLGNKEVCVKCKKEERTNVNFKTAPNNINAYIIVEVNSKKKEFLFDYVYADEKYNDYIQLSDGQEKAMTDTLFKIGYTMID